MGSAAQTIFVVDDDESVRTSLVRLLKSAGFAAVAYASAEDFLERVPPQSGGCLLLDIHMPGMSGLQLRDLLASEMRPFSVVVITADEGPAVGAARVVRKPFDDQALLDAVVAALRTN